MQIMSSIHNEVIRKHTNIHLLTTHIPLAFPMEHNHSHLILSVSFTFINSRMCPSAIWLYYWFSNCTMILDFIDVFTIKPKTSWTYSACDNKVTRGVSILHYWSLKKWNKVGNNKKHGAKTSARNGECISIVKKYRNVADVVKENSVTRKGIKGINGFHNNVATRAFKCVRVDNVEYRCHNKSQLQVHTHKCVHARTLIKPIESDTFGIRRE